MQDGKEYEVIKPEGPSDLDYLVLFEQMPGGAQILAELVNRFGLDPYVRGGHEADRETCFRAGQRRVVDYILDRINKANGA